MRGLEWSLLVLLIVVATGGTALYLHFRVDPVEERKKLDAKLDAKRAEKRQQLAATHAEASQRLDEVRKEWRETSAAAMETYEEDVEAVTETNRKLRELLRTQEQLPRNSNVDGALSSESALLEQIRTLADSLRDMNPPGPPGSASSARRWLAALSDPQQNSGRTQLNESERAAVALHASVYDAKLRDTGLLLLVDRRKPLVARQAATLREGQRDLVEALVTALPDDIDLAGAALATTERDLRAGDTRIECSLHPARELVFDAVAAELARDLGLASASSPDQRVGPLTQRNLNMYLTNVRRIPGTLHQRYSAEVVSHHYRRTLETPYRYEPDQPPQFPAEWTQSQKREGVLLHLHAQQLFFDAAAFLEAGLDVALTLEQRAKLAARGLRIFIVVADHPGR